MMPALPPPIAEALRMPPVVDMQHIPPALVIGGLIVVLIAMRIRYGLAISRLRRRSGRSSWTGAIGGFLVVAILLFALPRLMGAVDGVDAACSGVRNSLAGLSTTAIPGSARDIVGGIAVMLDRTCE